MNYNKFLSIAAVSLLILTSACNDDDDQGTKISRRYTAINLFTPVVESQPSFVTVSDYNIDMEVPANVITTRSENLSFNGAIHTLSVPVTKFTFHKFLDGDLISYEAPTASLDGQQGVISNFKCKISGLFYRLDGVVPNVDNSRKYEPVVMAQYNIGSLYSVATFQSDATYRGITSTTFAYQGQQMEYKTKSGSYRVVINPNTLKADVVLYRVKFAEQAPALILVLKDLDVTLGRNGYTISGNNIIPGQQDGAMLTPNESFPFESFTLTTTNDELSTVSINYTVRNKSMEDKIGNGARVVYEGAFSGSYVSDPEHPFNPDTPIED